MEMKSWSKSNGKVLNYGEAKELRKGEEMFEEWWGQEMPIYCIDIIISLYLIV